MKERKLLLNAQETHAAGLDPFHRNSYIRLTPMFKTFLIEKKSLDFSEILKTVVKDERPVN